MYVSWHVFMFAKYQACMHTGNDICGQSGNRVSTQT